MVVGKSSTVLKRLAALNRSSVLVKPLQYSQVKASLEGLAEELVLDILKRLEEQGASVTDPEDFVRSAAERLHADEEPAAETGSKRKLEADGASESGIVAKRVRLLNGSGQLARPIAYSRVREALGSLDVPQAMTILKGLEDVAEDVSDPTSYIRTAVRGAGGFVPLEEEGQDAENAGTGPPVSWKKVKAELPGYHSKTEDVTEAEKIEKRLQWLNRNAGLPTPIDPDEVLPALDCIGFRQAMRVLRRLEESASTVSDPGEFIKDTVARSGWIWAKPDIIDDDEKVAKRVAWMNMFGGLLQPIDYAEVADILDGLKVPHAMVLLRELEMQAHKVESPTDYIKRTAGLAGEDEVHVAVVDEDSSAAQFVTQLNQTGQLAAPIDLAEIGEDLARLGDEHALQLLQEVENKGSSVKDPTGYIKFKLKAKLASLGTSLEETADEETRIIKRIEWLNDYGGLLQDIDYDQVAEALKAVGVEHAMTILKELEDKRSSVQDPNALILSSAASARGRAQPQRRAPAKAKAAAAPEAGLATLAGFVGFLNQNRGAGSRRPVKFSEVAPLLDSLGPERAAQVLQEMQERGLGLEDPVTYLKAAAQRFSQAAGVAKKQAPAKETDDVAKITKRLEWLNQFGGLTRKIKASEVVGALYCLGLPQSMAILRGLQEKGSGVPDPTNYIKAAIQRANGMRVAVEAPVEDEEAYEGEAADELEEEDFGAGEEEEEDFGAEAEDGADAGEEEVDMGEEDYDEELPPVDEPEVPQKSTPPPKQPAKGLKTTAERRVVGGLTGYKHLVPTRPGYATGAGTGGVKAELIEEESKPVEEPSEQPPTHPTTLPLTPQEKLVQIRDYAMKNGLQLDQVCLKHLCRLPYFKAKDMIDDVLLGGRNRQGVSNPSRYLTIGVQKLSVALGVEQGIAMELAVSLGVVLNNDALDELACIPRKEAHNIIREISRNAEARKDPIRFIQAEVMKCRAQMDARPFPPTRS